MKRLLLTALIAFSSPALAQESSLPACEKNGYFNNCHASYTWADGRRYIGKWKGNTPHGEGTMTYTDGDKYIGEYKDGKKNGKGTYTYADGDKYIGEHKDGNSHGQGTYTFAHGDKYVGEFKDDKRNGKGTYTFADGSKYVGEWKDGNSHGQGTYTNIAGQSVTEVWEMGSYIGTKAEVDEQERARKAEEARKVQAKKEAEDKFKKIYNACLLDKSSKIDMQVMALKEALEATCEAIAKNPSWYEELKYN